MKRSITSYCYVASNPVKFIDPDGNDIVISGKENTSITLTTDLIDIKVNAASLGINWGGNYTLQGEAVLSATLDIVGIFDPSGAADALNATLQAKNNEWLDAGISLAGIIPYVGDIAKAGKIKKDVKIIETAIDACKQGHKKAKVVHGNSKASTKAQHVYEIFDKETGKAVKTGISSGKKTKAGKSYRANSQVNRWNRQAGKQKFDSRVVEDVPAGPNARQKALNAERANAQKLRNQGEIDPQYHKRP